MDRKMEHTWKIYEHNNEWIKVSDTKASIVLATNGVILAFFFKDISSIFPLIIKQEFLFILFFILIYCIFLSIFYSIMCLVPRVGKSNPSILFFEHINSFPRLEEYKKKFNTVLRSEIDLRFEVINQIWDISIIASKKFNYVKKSILFLGLTILLLLFLLLGIL